MQGEPNNKAAWATSWEKRNNVLLRAETLPNLIS